MSISSKNEAYAQKVVEQLKASGLRTELDIRDEKIGYKIREAQLAKVPYMLIVGDEESTNNSVSVRSRDDGSLGSMLLSEFLAKAVEENSSDF